MLANAVVETFLLSHDVIAFTYSKALDVKEALNNKIGGVAKYVFLGCLIKNNAYLGAIFYFIGMAFPAESEKKINLIWSAIFDPKIKDMEEKLNESQNERIRQAKKNVDTFFIRLQPLVCTGLIGFFALPVVSIQMVSALGALHLGSQFGKNANF